MKTFLKVAVVLIVALATIGAQVFAAENVRGKGPVQDFFRIGWDSPVRPGGPLDEFNNRRSVKINDYVRTVSGATSTYQSERERFYKAYEAVITNAKSTSKEKKAASDEYEKNIDKVKAKWSESEQNAYNSLVNGLRNDYNYAVQRRTNEYRNARRKITYYLKLSARSKSSMGGGRYHSYTHIPEDDIAIGKVSGYAGIGAVEWEIADAACANPDTYNCRGNNLDRRNVYFVPDPNVVGIRIDFQMDGADWHRKTKWYTCECDPWCEFRPTQAWSAKQARNDMGGLTDVDLVSCQKLLTAVKFQRAKKPWD